MATSDADHQNPRIARRGLCEGVTKLLQGIHEELDKDGGGSNMRQRVFLNKLNEKLKKAIRLDFQVMESITNAEEAEAEQKEADEKMMNMEEMIAYLRERLGDEDLPAPEDNKDDGKKVQSFAKLPKLEIKYFTGDPLEFPSFQDQFEAPIGRSELANVGKFS